MHKKHIDDKVSKAKKSVGIIKYLNNVLPLKSLVQMYKILGRSHLDYCDFIYHIPAKLDHFFGLTLHGHMETLEKVQYQAALAVTGAWQGSSRSKIYEELGWESLSDRRMCKRVLQFHKIIDNKTPEYLREKIPPKRNKLLNLPYVFKDFNCRTDRYSNSFFPDATSFWNNIISSFQDFPTYFLGSASSQKLLNL